MKKWIMLTAFMLAGTSLLSACGTSDSTSTTVDQKQAEAKKVNITFWSFARWNGIKGTEKDGVVGDWEKDAAKRFMEKHPNVSVDVEIINAKGGPEKLALAIQTNSPPDVLEDALNRFLEYAGKDLLVPLDTYLDKENLDDYEKTIYDQGIIGDGKHYYLPWGVSPQVMLLNRTLFKQAGIDNLIPKNEDKTWTQDEYLKAITEVQSKLKNVYGLGTFGDTSSGDSFMLNWLWSSGARTFDPNYTKVTLNDAKGLAGLKFFKKLNDEKLTNPGAAGIKAADAITLFEQQKVATVVAATINYARTVKSMNDGQIPKFDIEAVMVPNAAGEKPATFVHAYGFGVFKTPDLDKQKWAVEFAKFLGNKENAGAVKAAESFSSRKSQANLYSDSTDPNTKYASHILKYTVDGGLAAPGFAKQRTQFAKHLQAMLTGKKSAEDTLKDFETETNTIMKEERALMKTGSSK